MPDPLPLLAEIFRGIKSGRHWSFPDEEFVAMNGPLFDSYRDYFSQIQLSLHRDPRGFIYALDEDASVKGNLSVSSYVVFAAVWIEALADQGADVIRTILDKSHSFSELPHFSSLIHEKHLVAAGISSPDKLRGVVGDLIRLGVCTQVSEDRFQMRPGFHRFLDVCLHETARDAQPIEP